MIKEKDEVRSCPSSDEQFIGEDCILDDKEAKFRRKAKVLMNHVKVYGALNRLIDSVNEKYPYLKGEMYDLYKEDCTLPRQMWLKLHADCGGTFCWHVAVLLDNELEKEGIDLLKELIEDYENKQNI